MLGLQAGFTTSGLCLILIYTIILSHTFSGRYVTFYENNITNFISLWHLYFMLSLASILKGNIFYKTYTGERAYAHIDTYKSRIKWIHGRYNRKEIGSRLVSCVFVSWGRTDAQRRIKMFFVFVLWGRIGILQAFVVNYRN